MTGWKIRIGTADSNNNIYVLCVVCDNIFAVLQEAFVN